MMHCQGLGIPLAEPHCTAAPSPLWGAQGLLPRTLVGQVSAASSRVTEHERWHESVIAELIFR